MSNYQVPVHAYMSPSFVTVTPEAALSEAYEMSGLDFARAVAL